MVRTDYLTHKTCREIVDGCTKHTCTKERTSGTDCSDSLRNWCLVRTKFTETPKHSGISTLLRLKTSCYPSIYHKQLVSDLTRVSPAEETLSPLHLRPSSDNWPIRSFLRTSFLFFGSSTSKGRLRCPINLAFIISTSNALVPGE